MIFVCIAAILCARTARRIDVDPAVHSRDRPTFDAPRDLADARTADNFSLQSFVISLREERAASCVGRNLGLTDLRRTAWFPAANGYDQTTLDEFFNITNTTRLRGDEFREGDKHIIGCFVSHRHLLRLALRGWEATVDVRPGHRRPDALLILEDDASCVSGALEGIRETLPRLPKKWDLFYIGGKPFSYFNQTLNAGDVTNEKRGTLQLKKQGQFAESACRGVFGRSTTGPFAPDGSRDIDPSGQPYWRTSYLIDTHAYVVNPRRLERVLQIVEEPRKRITPIDMVYAEAMRAGRIHAYMSTYEYCAQQELSDHDKEHGEIRWKGYYSHPKMSPKFHWDYMHIPDCPGY